MEPAIALFAMLGAAFQEAAHWYAKRHQLTHKKHRALLRDKGYWALMLVFVVLSGLAVSTWYAGRPEPPLPGEAMLFGAGLPAILQKLIIAFRPNEVTAGPTHEAPRGALASYFG